MLVSTSGFLLLTNGVTGCASVWLCSTFLSTVLSPSSSSVTASPSHTVTPAHVPEGVPTIFSPNQLQALITQFHSSSPSVQFASPAANTFPVITIPATASSPIPFCLAPFFPSLSLSLSLSPPLYLSFSLSLSLPLYIHMYIL